MEDKKFTTGWLKFLILHDHISKVLLLLSVAGLVIFGLGGFEAMTLGTIAGGLLVVAGLYSFGSYVFIGKYRESCVNKFYDDVRYSADWPMEYQGRDLKKIKISWKGRTVKTLSLVASTNSPAVQSSNEWRTLKRAAMENFKFENKNLLVFLEKHSSGVFSFTSASNLQAASIPEVSLALSKENMYAFAYETLSSHGYNLPWITRFDADFEEGRTKLKTVELRFEHHMTDYDIQRFESAFIRQHQGTGSQWVFEWTASSVVIKAIERGSDEERIVNATQSLERLVQAAVSTGFSIHNKDEYVFDSADIKWNHKPFYAESFNINFLRSDVSRPSRIEEFEKLMVQGLTQLFPATYWDFSWDVSAINKVVYIRRIEESDIAVKTTQISSEDDVSMSPTQSAYVFEAPAEEPVAAPRPAVNRTTAPARVSVPAPTPPRSVSLPPRPKMKLPPRPPKMDL